MDINNKTIRISKPDIFSFSECLHFLDRGYDDCLYTIDGDRVFKPLRIGDRQELIQVKEVDDVLEVTLLTGGTAKDALRIATDFVTEWFDLERDLQPFYQLLNSDDRLSWMTERFFGLRLMGIPDLFEALCWCVIGQQINLTFAYRLKRKLVETYGTFITYEGRRYYYFPEPELLAGLTVKELKELQFSRQKAEYIIGIANDFADNSLSKKHLANMGSKQMVSRLMNIRGVGEWTANYVLMKSLRKPDCITHGDTGLQTAVSSVLDLDRKPKRDEVETVFDAYTGWESYLVIYLWRTLSQ
ncbi:DNA-3-methyladenine glycosylase [Aliifodinibius sp. S!AR15-10]|uniref:DNA-3-methyladenine glycosylase family protein n=1 Tax=Aliifodinibius sp. S!AR15-10 TaxID=2950437 RepID=UPI00285DC502|nr:DNA-3-methyladenine glycosylase [Aliifodinibius sp. S!AR15-10]MDR8391388.1 DNA-3-methyladenine glycosylase [Aliifodinibius sp. S!AR15-10]